MQWPLRSLWQLAALALLLLGVSGCTTVLSEGAKRAAESRHASDFFTDAQIGTRLFSNLAQKDAGLAMDINIDVWEQRVMLTGTVADARTRAEVVQGVRADKRVLKVYDEIQVVSADELARRRAAVNQRDAGKKEGFERFANDYWIETKITGQLIATKEVSSVNLRWRSQHRLRLGTGPIFGGAPPGHGRHSCGGGRGATQVFCGGQEIPLAAAHRQSGVMVVSQRLSGYYKKLLSQQPPDQRQAQIPRHQPGMAGQATLGGKGQEAVNAQFDRKALEPQGLAKRQMGEPQMVVVKVPVLARQVAQIGP
jgi:osmotically-inducible protein OsmY